MHLKGKKFCCSKYTTKLFLRYKYIIPSSFRNCKQIISPSELQSL